MTTPATTKTVRAAFARLLAAGLCACALPAPASAHVGLYLPNGGQTLTPGTTYRIQWRVVIEHGQDDWDLYYSTTGPAGPFVPIALDLPAGDTSSGAVHTYDWVVPNTPSTDVYVRVVQDNTSGPDYADESNQPLTIGQTASAVVYEGVFTNPVCLSTGAAPVLGSNWSLTTDHSLYPGASATYLLGYLHPALAAFTPAGELLVDVASPRLVKHVAQATGSSTTFTAPIPNDVALIGLHITFQAGVLAPAGLRLCNAIEAVAGL